MAKKGSKFKKYSVEFKLQVVQDYFSGANGGLTKIMKKYQLSSSWPIRQWIKKYKKSPELLGIETRGRHAQGRPRKTHLETMSLQDQNTYLKMENDILKKL